MSGRRPRLMIGKLSDLLVSGKKPGFFLDAATSPTGSLDINTPSPRGMKRYDVGGVGLGIVAALDKSGSNLIVVNSGKNLEMENLEEITYVISHGSGKSSTKVYYDGGEQRRKCNSSGENGHGARFVEDFRYPTSYFLSCCHLCRKQLHGKDIYMYRGEKAFCSSDCRSTQIMMDEMKERCRSEVSRSAKVSTSYNSGEIFFSTGILAI
ncbi:FCS-Like Zinc finger 13-like isoform X5 [Hibiscus syriacus]|uniref:FCS-Like Zinc finger 13-like isoform X5 n=1 Tax=Hibiscus syriacus TaxID=106335 RepID=UPI0019241E6A|nr:FCS-Like Zinc finger 13-like isoform X5 [Hibiscus syriacus]